MTGGNGDEIVLEETKFSLPAEGGRVDVTFVPVAAWSATCAESFVTITPSSGEMSAEEVTVSISVGKNTTPLERVIKVLLTVGEQDIVLTITQAQAVNGPDTPDIPEPDVPPGPEPDNGCDASNEDVVPGDSIAITK